MQQKQQKQKKIRNWILWLVCLVLLIGTGVATFAVWNVVKKDEVSHQEVSEKIEAEEEKEIKKVDEVKSGEIAEETDKTNAGKKVTQFEGEDPNEAESLSGVVTMAGVVDGNLMIRTSIDQYLGTGSCELQIVRNGNIIYSETADIVAAASTSSCQGFDVPVAAIGNGNVQIMINLSSGEKTGTINGEANL